MKMKLAQILILLSSILTTVSCGQLDSMLGNSKSAGISAGDIPEFSVQNIRTASNLQASSNLGISSEFTTDTDHKIDCIAALNYANDAPQLIYTTTTGFDRINSLYAQSNFYDCVSREQVQQFGFENYDNDENKFISIFEEGESDYNVGWETIGDTQIKGMLVNIQNLDDGYSDNTKFVLDEGTTTKDSLLIFTTSIGYAATIHIVEILNAGRLEHKISSRVFSTDNGIIEFYAHLIDGVGGSTAQAICPDLKTDFNADCNAAFDITYYDQNFSVIAGGLTPDGITADPTTLAGVRTADYIIQGSLNSFFAQKYFN